jgi:hypothetical protein
MAHRQRRVVEVIGGIVGHPDSLHHRDRSDVRRYGERNDLLEPSVLETERQ